MIPFREKPLAWMLSLACGCAGAADDSALGLKPDAGGLRLRLQPTLIRLPAEGQASLPIFIEADRMQGRQDRDVEAEGGVRLRRRGQALFADWLRYDKNENEVNAKGNVRLEQRGDIVEGASVRLNMSTDRGEIENASYTVRINNAQGRGAGDRVLLEGPDKYRVLGGSYTSCEVGNDDWFVRAKEFEIDKGRQLGTARNASIVFHGQTILYTPYLSFSLDRQRKSGFLSPTLGTTGSSGIDFALPYYWNIAPNRDATITPRILQKRGLMLNTEVRYLEPSLSGDVRLEVLPGDRVRNDDDRYFMALRHNQTWSSGWNGNLNIQKVSDDRYFTDLSTRIATTSQSLLPREGTLAKAGSWWDGGTWAVSALAQRWQTLQTDPLVPLLAPYNRLQLALSASKQHVTGLDFDLSSSLVDFSHPTLISGQRAVAYPSVSLPLQTSYAYLTPRAGVHYTHYDLNRSAPAGQNINRTAPIFSTDGGLIFERDAALGGLDLRQTLEPRLYYVYIPTREQNLIPNFDSGVQDINFATLFAENQFGGGDRINDANQLTFGVTSRILHRESGIERLRIGVGQRYYFKSQEVILPGVPARASSNSDLLAVISGLVAPHWTVEGGWQYTTDLSQTQRLNAGARYQPAPGKVVNVTYRYTNGALLTPNQPLTAPAPNNTLRQIDLSAQWPLTRHWSGVARWNYSIPDSRLVEGLAGLEFDGECWSFRIVAHRFATATQDQVSSVYLQLELNGLSRIGSNVLELLRRNVAGYQRPDNPVERSREIY